MPPMMITTKARIRMFSPMPICEDRPLHHAGEAGERRAEAKHRRVKKLDIEPSAPTISRLEAPARISMPSRVRITSA